MSFQCDLEADKNTSATEVVEPLWFLAYTRPRLEAVALQNLQQQGFEAYLPLYKRLKKTESNIETVFEPMFARYVFFRTSRPNQSIAPVRSTRGVAHVVRFGYEIATIRPATLDAIRLLEQERNAVDVAELSSLRPGQVVRFRIPALSGLEGLVKSVSSRRVTVLLELMGRQQAIKVDHHQLEAA
jgi:transcriptional antiterminator RfaH